MSESKELAAHEPGRSDVAQRPSATIPVEQRLTLIREALTNPAVDTGKAREMMLLLRDMEQDEKQAEFNRDKGRAIRAMPAIFKKGENTHTGNKYAKFEDMHRAVMPVLSNHNLTLDFRIGYEANWITVQPILRHDNGFIEEGGVMKGPSDEGKGRSAIQAIGSASSYLKRYSMRAMLNLIEDGEDDDGMGVGRPDYQMNDRQEGLIVDAQAAYDRGEYAAWYGLQNNRDKAVIINSGTHARLGGGTALPGPVSRTPDPDPPAERDQRRPAQERRTDPPSDPEKPDVTTPEGWTRQYEMDCADAADKAALESVQKKAAGGLAKLKNGGLTGRSRLAVMLSPASPRRSAINLFSTNRSGHVRRTHYQHPRKSWGLRRIRHGQEGRAAFRIAGWRSFRTAHDRLLG